MTRCGYQAHWLKKLVLQGKIKYIRTSQSGNNTSMYKDIIQLMLKNCLGVGLTISQDWRRLGQVAFWELQKIKSS
jgi:hypothetical protein